MISKDDFDIFVKSKIIEEKIKERLNEFFKSIKIETEDLFCNQESIKIILFYNKLHEGIIPIHILHDGKNIIKSYECSSEILFNEASYLIELRNIKDIFYEIKNAKSNKKTFWKWLFG